MGIATLLQETHLARPLCEVSRLLPAKLFLTHPSNLFYPAGIRIIQTPINEFPADTFLLQFVTYAHRPITARTACGQQRFGETCVGDEPLAFERRNRHLHHPFRIPSGIKLCLQFCAAVFAPRKHVERGLPRLRPIRRIAGGPPTRYQASASCGIPGSSSAVAFPPCGKWRVSSRTRVSISAAID